MALQQQNVSLNLANGIDQKTESKIGPDNKFASMFDWIYKKAGKLYKRYGTSKLTDTVVTSFPNALTIGTSEIPSSLFSHKDQLVCQNKGALYSFYEDQDKWYFKGHYYPLEVDTQTSVASEKQYLTPTSYYIAGLRIIVYQSHDPQSSSFGNRYTVIENSTGNYLIDDVALPSGTDYRILAFSSRCYLIFQSSTNLKIAEIDLTTGALGADTNLLTDVKVPPFLSTSEWAYQYILTNKAGVGERAMLVYYTSSDQVKIVAIQNNGTLDSGIVAYTNAQNVVRGFAIQYNAPSDTLFIIYQLNTFAVRYEALTFSSSAFTSVTAQTIKTLTANAISFDLINSPVSTSQVFVLFDELKSNGYLDLNIGKTVFEPVINKAVISNPGGVVVAASDYIKGFELAARGVSDTLRNTIYSFIQNTAGNQKTYFMIDLLKGKSENAPFVQAKWLYGQAVERLNASLPQTSMIENTVYISTQKLMARVGSPSGNTTSAPALFERIGVAETFINLAPEKSGTNSFLGNAVHTSGGYLGYYDGSTFCESSYFLQPEFMDVQTMNALTGGRMTIAVTQEGDATKPEITNIALTNGPLQLQGPGNYWSFFTTASQVNVGYRINGAGTIPVAPGTNILVDINSNDTASQVVQKSVAAISAAGVAASVTMTAYNQLTITNNSNGSVSNASAANYVQSVIPTTGLEIGTYFYRALWTYFDVHGQIVYSAPSPAARLVTITNNDLASIVIYAPVLTNREANTVRISLWRTKKNSTEYFKVSQFSEDKAWSVGTWQYSFLDDLTDLGIDNSPQLLYTTGGILSNFQVPAVKHVSRFKNRLIASGLDNPNGYFYSKEVIDGAPVEFAEELFVQLDNDSDPVVGTAQLDDKIISFKGQKIYYQAGDGANDLGAGSTLSRPQLISSDTGLENHNSVVEFPNGLIFKSAKGIYLLDRSLSVSYIGKEVEGFNQFKVGRAQLLEQDNQIRFELQDAPYALVYDYLFGRWAVFSQYGGTDATNWKTKFSRIDYSGRVYVEDKNSWIDVGSSTPSYTPTFMTNWLQIKNVQDYQRVWRMIILGDLKSPHVLRVRAYYDYDETNFDEYEFDSSAISGSAYADSVYEPEFHLKRQKCDAIRLEVFVEPIGGTEESLELVDMSFLVGIKSGLQKVKAGKKL